MTQSKFTAINHTSHRPKRNTQPPDRYSDAPLHPRELSEGLRRSEASRRTEGTCDDGAVDVGPQGASDVQNTVEPRNQESGLGNSKRKQDESVAESDATEGRATKKPHVDCERRHRLPIAASANVS